MAANFIKFLRGNTSASTSRPNQRRSQNFFNKAELSGGHPECDAEPRKTHQSFQDVLTEPWCDLIKISVDNDNNNKSSHILSVKRNFNPVLNLIPLIHRIKTHLFEKGRPFQKNHLFYKKTHQLSGLAGRESRCKNYRIKELTILRKKWHIDP